MWVLLLWLTHLATLRYLSVSTPCSLGSAAFPWDYYLNSPGRRCVQFLCFCDWTRQRAAAASSCVPRSCDVNRLLSHQNIYMMIGDCFCDCWTHSGNMSLKCSFMFWGHVLCFWPLCSFVFSRSPLLWMDVIWTTFILCTFYQSNTVRSETRADLGHPDKS